MKYLYLMLIVSTFMSTFRFIAIKPGFIEFLVRVAQTDFCSVTPKIANKTTKLNIIIKHPKRSKTNENVNFQFSDSNIEPRPKKFKRRRSFSVLISKHSNVDRENNVSRFEFRTQLSYWLSYWLSLLTKLRNYQTGLDCVQPILGRVHWLHHCWTH